MFKKKYVALFSYMQHNLFIENPTYSQTEEEGSAVVVESPRSAYHHYSQAVTQAAWTVGTL